MSTFAERLRQLGQPDIIVILTDQERAIQHFPAGWEQANLPSMGRLKRRGFSFERAFCNSCMCSPSRATFFTGTYPAQHKVTQTLTTGGRYSSAETELKATLPNLGRMLDDHGYDVHYRGKWHLSKGRDGNELVSSDIALYGFRGWQAPDAGEDTRPENFGGGYANHDLDYVRQALDFLAQVRERRARPGAAHRPYCLVLSLVNPHDVLCYPKGFDYGYGPEWLEGDIELPATVDENLLENRKPMAQRQALLVANKALGYLPTDQDKRNYLNFYGNTIKLADREVGKVLDALDEPGPAGTPSLAEQAVVFRLADHGELGMTHGGMRQKAFVAYEEVLRVPLIVSNPVLFPPPAEPDPAARQSTEHLASLIDVLPTIAALTGATPPADLRGVDLTPLFERDEPVQDAVLFTFDDTKASANSVASAVHAANRLRCLRTRDWKYVEYFHALGSYPTEYELYYLGRPDAPDEPAPGQHPKPDPDERHNLAYDEAYAAKRQELAQQLRQLEQEKLLTHPGRAAAGTAYRHHPHPDLRANHPDPEAAALVPDEAWPTE